jgi:hypothetical protein
MPHAATRLADVALSPRYQMHVSMEHRLTRILPAVEPDVEASH